MGSHRHKLAGGSLPDGQFAAYAAGETVEAFIEPRAVGSPLPPAPLFLAPGWYIPLPLEETYMATWQAYPEPWRKLLSL